MAIELKPETEQLVNEEIESGHFQNVDDLLTRAIYALREKDETADTTARRSGTPLRVVDALLSPPFIHSELYIPPRQKDYLRPVDL